MTDALTFAASAPFVALIIQLLIKPLFPAVQGRLTPIVAFVIACAWGGVLSYTGDFKGSAAEFIFLAVTVAAAAAGVKSWVDEVRMGNGSDG